ncbi:hypothetical protein [Mesorhizobium sp.]|uniref:hypothetical protein n=1 Tax=Mesorhizobium sp. TaxID=1871066 RepID=UPI002581070D|nr:hypothetical protein [Mesorhizobium sp.]
MVADDELQRELAGLEARCETDEDRKHLASIKRTLQKMERTRNRMLARLDKLPKTTGN